MEIHLSLSSIKITKAVGPDNIPNKLPKDFANELTPSIMDIYNQSLRESYIPSMLKSSIVNPIPKSSIPKDIESDLRPISLTCTLAKIMEGFTCTRLLSYLVEKMDDRQYASRGHSSRIDGVLSEWKLLRGGIPQGTKLGVILFNIMTYC
ncbi:Hypothetical predicted protein [Paramuricea clavata]|uniref:Uncharacterized protein n=1 Tax=Paramuricea clavata TaxID=317549 RepID=A0A7D9DDY3_PARCT|nr:Hypothetical predicted protein [Paramuricea clavata]